ncbi:MAG: hypothetical protein A4E65_02378 [Syntrophorhabdus sp. PtaU1.Bin153]|nr:MAG: hypothetical protein A4E65_02378 [Syntrophorhabdus sp. PtaU1.Bin153]
MAITTTFEQLEEVQAAITAVMSGQAYTWPSSGLSVTKADLKALSDREEILLKRYRAETGTGGMAINVGIPRRD